MSVRTKRFLALAALAVALRLTASAGLSDNDCLACHSDQTLTKTNGAGRNLSLFVDAAVLKASAHSSLGCADCHDDLAPEHPDDNKRARAVSCASCHETAAEELAASAHKSALTCADCHEGHATRPVARDRNQLGSVETCSRCHASERLNTRYNLPADRVKTFFESYHGLASQYGSTVAANCASCHGYHKILPSADPGSTIHRSRLQATCGQCHPGASEKFAAGKIHVDPNGTANGADFGSRINWWVRRVYLLLIVGVVGAMFIHNALGFLKKIRARLHAEGRTVLRMTRSQRWQHAVLAVSFIMLAVTGFALKFPDSWLAMLLGGSEPLRRWAHRVAGVVLLGVGLYHLIYLVRTRDGRRLVSDLFPVKADFTGAWNAARHLVGLRKERPEFGRFGYAEKLEYWAVVWGTIIMGVTGLIVWFKVDVTQWLPRWAVDVALTIHYYEAILACLAIVVWHFYHVMFDPGVYPLNPACWDGKVSEEWQREEHAREATADSAPPPK